MRTIESGERMEVPGLGPVRLGHVLSRNWSHVAPATGPGGAHLFVKQFVDRLGRAHVRGFDGELRTRASLEAVELPGVAVVPVLAEHRERLVLVFRYRVLTTIDSIALATRADGRAARAVGEALERILEARRDPERADVVHVWKGLDPKNVGWDGERRLWIFDFGPPAELDQADAAGRLIAAGLLSRWVARPGLHLVWPERSILRGVCEPVAHRTTLAEVERRLDQNHELRRLEPQRRGARARAVRFGLDTIGRAYWSTARREARRMLTP